MILLMTMIMMVPIPTQLMVGDNSAVDGFDDDDNDDNSTVKYDFDNSLMTLTLGQTNH